MIDCHYDLLTILYCCYLKNDFSYINKIKEDFKDNVKGVVANLYFMSKESMKEELNIEKIDVFEMFKISTNLFKEYFQDTKVVFSIEGCDFIENIEELDELYKLGLRNILLVWNNSNKYGSGNYTEYGLTDLGKKFIKHASSLGISIDVSHMNKKTFWDTINYLKQIKEYNPKVIASHSNCYSICPNKRNLDDEQIIALKELNAVIGVVSYGPFISENCYNLEQNYLEHFKHLEKLIGINNIAVATDNMDFVIELFNKKEDISLLKHKNIKNKLEEILKIHFNDKDCNKIIYKNIYNKLFN